jgi:hypothetical protein
MLMRELLCLIFLAGGVLPAKPLEYAPAPVDNPLKGMVPYVSSNSVDRFPHSMEFRYFPLNKIMKARGVYDWSAIEETLAVTRKRGCQLVMRVYLEYPGHGNEVPQFLIDEGVKVVKWTGENTGVATSYTPDYEDPRLRSAMREFIAAYGKKYDGDPRVGYVTMGMLGSWGEWHNFPREDLWASKEVQAEVMDAFEQAFKVTPVLVRYPAGPETWKMASNVERRLGYHDDSFCWATLETGKKEDEWFFVPAMKKVGADEKWKRYPIGGELRPELWTKSFTDDPHERDQGFRKCVEATHVTWLMDTGLFQKEFPMSEARKRQAEEEVRRMGYEYHLAKAEVTEEGVLELTVENRGVAPFYADWPVTIEARRPGKAGVRETRRGLLAGLLPGESRVWKLLVGEGVTGARVGVPNPMPGGKPLRFANKEQGEQWLEIEF